MGCSGQGGAGSLTEEQVRQELAAAHWATNYWGMDDLVWNHISARLDDGTVLITPGNLLWDEIAPHQLVKGSENKTANIIHDALYNARPDVRAVVHLHTRAAVAVSCLADGFCCLDQNSAQFYERIAYHDYQGVSDDAAEQQSIANDIGSCASVLVMRNHGFCTVGCSVGEAWVRAWYFEKCCQLQMDIMASGGDITLPSEKALSRASRQYKTAFEPGRWEWPAIMRLWRRYTKNTRRRLHCL